MSLSIYCNPRLFIDGREISICTSATFQETGGNALQKLTANFSDPDLVNITLYNKRVEFFLNYGSEDCSPLFRGIIISRRKCLSSSYR